MGEFQCEKSNIFVKFEWHYIWHKINIVFHEKKIIQTAKHCAGSLGPGCLDVIDENMSCALCCLAISSFLEDQVHSGYAG